MRKYRVVAVVAATLGVMFVAGGAFAASRFIITNVNQIKPSVRAQLRGNQGRRGLTGPQGIQGLQGLQGPQGIPGAPGAAGSARAVAVVNADGSLLSGSGFPRNVTGVSHTPGSGIYCIALSAGIDPNDALATAAGGAVGVLTVPDSTNCSSGNAEVDTFILVESGTTTQGTPLDPVFNDGGFAVLVP